MCMAFQNTYFGADRTARWVKASISHQVWQPGSVSESHMIGERIPKLFSDFLCTYTNTHTLKMNHHPTSHLRTQTTNNVTAWIESSIELIFIKCNDNDLENLAFLLCPIYIKGATLKLQTVPGNISSPSILLCFDWYISETIGGKCNFFDIICLGRHWRIRNEKSKETAVRDLLDSWRKALTCSNLPVKYMLATVVTETTKEDKCILSIKLLL